MWFYSIETPVFVITKSIVIYSVPSVGRIFTWAFNLLDSISCWVLFVSSQITLNNSIPFWICIVESIVDASFIN